MNILQDKNINGRDVSIYETENGITLDIKHPCGELIYGWEGIDKFFTAERLAETYIYALGKPEKAHCEDEYCQETHSDRNFIYSTGEQHNEQI